MLSPYYIDCFNTLKNYIIRTKSNIFYIRDFQKSSLLNRGCAYKMLRLAVDRKLIKLNTNYSYIALTWDVEKWNEVVKSLKGDVQVAQDKTEPEQVSSLHEKLDYIIRRLDLLVRVATVPAEIMKKALNPDNVRSDNAESKATSN